MKTILPEGLAGKIPAVTQCAEPQATDGTCTAASRIGTATVTAGAGSSPYTFSGPVYMTGPYNGAPFGLSIAVPAVAGPFNLGTVVTRATINVNPYTARVTAESVLPTIFKGIPLRMRSINVEVNRQGFLYNATSCESGRPKRRSRSTFGAVQEGLSSPFELEGCSSLAFKPAFAASTSGRPTKADGTSLTTTITQGAGQANINSVLVTLPYKLPSRLSTLNKACLAATFEANPSGCPAASRVGTATAVTPLLPGTMTGTRLLHLARRRTVPRPRCGARRRRRARDPRGQNENHARHHDDELRGLARRAREQLHAESRRRDRTRRSAPTGTCARAKLIMPTVITGQNGKQLKLNTVIKPAGCPVQVVGHKVVGTTAYLTIKTFEAGRISAGGSGVATVYRTLGSANGAASAEGAAVAVGLGRRPLKRAPARRLQTEELEGAQLAVVRYGALRLIAPRRPG